MFAQGLLPLLSHPGTQRLLKPHSKGVQLPLELVAVLDIIELVVLFVSFKMQALWDHGGFHSDYKGKPESSDKVWKDRIPCEELLRGQWMKLFG
jgi:hypothetical protein